MRKAFTLIELMVVVTIIVVLLAMLTPAMDRAIYQAEMATCGGNFKGMGNALVVYASDNKRYYPICRGWGGRCSMSISRRATTL